MKRKKSRLTFVVISVPLFLYGGLWLLSGMHPGEGDAEWQSMVDLSGWSRDMDLDGARLHYIEAGEGPPVLLIHGYADSSYSWHKNIGPIAEAGFHVFALDIPGLGESGIPAGYDFTPEAMAETVLKFLDQKRISKVHLVGNSMGGNLILYMAVNHPERVDRIVPVDPACYPYWRHIYAAALGRSKIAAALIRPLVGPWAFKFGLRRIYYDPRKVTEGILDQKTKPFHRPEFPDTLVRMGGNYFGKTFIKTSERFGEIKAPTLLVWGSNDRMVDTELFAERLHRDIPGSELTIIPFSGHLPHQETAEEFNPLVIRFLSGN